MPLLSNEESANTHLAFAELQRQHEQEKKAQKARQLLAEARRKYQ